jgi:hypothetical protein
MVSWDARAAQGNRYFYLYPAYLKNQSDGHWPRRRIHVSTLIPTLTSYNGDMATVRPAKVAGSDPAPSSGLRVLRNAVRARPSQGVR